MGQLLRREIKIAREPFSVLEGAPDERRHDHPDVIWSHAAGFHSAAYGPLLRKIADHARIQARDARGHGHSTADSNPAMLTSWQVYYDDLIRSLDELPTDQKVILAGHSTGATTSVFAAAARPGRVSALILIEPVFYLPIIGYKPRKFLMTAAARRRRSFLSTDEAYEAFRKKSGFKGLSDEWLRSYVDHAFVKAETEEYVLRCTPEWEFQTYNTNERWPWLAIMKTRAPTTLLVAEQGSSCPPSSRKLIRLLKPSWAICTVPKTTHLLPMEVPSSVVDAVLSAFREYPATKC